MTTDQKFSAAVQIGRERAEQALTRRRAVREKRAQALADVRSPIQVNIQTTGSDGVQHLTSHLSAGYLVALGDSWFEYPFGDDILGGLEARGYDIESAAHHGDRLEVMAYDGGQIDGFAACIEKIKHHGNIPKAVLVSGGGNDIVADDFGLLLNSAVSPIGGWNYEILDGLINERVQTSYHSLFTMINTICDCEVGHLLPVVFHGYDYLVPDGRGILFGWLAGPWLRPGFHEKNFPDLPTNRDMMKVLINRLNDMLSSLATDSSFSNLHYLDLRNTLSNDLTGGKYKQSWANELHPTNEGFDALAARFATLIATL
jgi:hypothetical protein